MEIVGQILSGAYGELLVRQKSDQEIELGELLVAEGKKKLILQVYNLSYGSQIPPKTLELLSGMQLEGYGGNLDFFEKELRNYTLAEVKGLVVVDKNPRIPKTLPNFFSTIRRIEASDLDFLKSSDHPLKLGTVRSGSRDVGIDVIIDGRSALSHHILIPATTGKGKSNLLKMVAWDLVDKDYCALLILDPHDEYYGRTGLGLKDHERSDKVLYYSQNPPPGAMTLALNAKLLKPWHFHGVIDFSTAQRDALYVYYKKDKENWISNILDEIQEPENGIKPETLSVVQRKLKILGIGDDIFPMDNRGREVITNVVSSIEGGKTVIVDTSDLSSSQELLIGSVVSGTILDKYKSYKKSGALKDKPVVAIVLEEAPRVIGKDVLQTGPNIFSTIAREGRKFQVGLIAITQLPSLIPQEILANINTKIILGLEMGPERHAIIESAAQDLSKDDRNIASLNKGEALVSSTFTNFAIPISIKLFEQTFKEKAKQKIKKDFSAFK